MKDNNHAVNTNNQQLSRRSFVKSATAVAAFTIVPRHVLGQPGKSPPSGKLNIAGIGVGGRGGDDINEVSSENIVALCDVDEAQAGGTIKKFPKARVYKDFRKMLDKENKNIDAVVIGTPDHVHAPAAIMAMKMGKHVYVEKPMAHTIFEAREMTRVAREMKVVTQMGNQGHAGEGLRLTYEFIHDGAIGRVHEVHVWSDRPIWPQGIDRPKETDPVPPTLDWDLWLGPAPNRPYNKCYVPFNWRGWWDFGCGAMGDMAVHNADPAWFCLNLGAPFVVEADTDDINNETFPKWQIIDYYFPRRGNMPPVKLTWYDGGKMPPRPPELEEGRNLDGNGIMFVGDKGKILCGGWSGAPRIIPELKMKEYKRPEKTLPRSIGHHKEWIQACKDKNPKGALAGFEYSGPFTEGLLVGNLAVRLGKHIEYDAKNMKATGIPEADKLINKEYRKGWSIT
jgi:predicted dehydrogenase